MNNIPIARILERFDRLMAQKDHAGAEQHLNNWLREAEDCGDSRGKLSVMNEQIGFYRRTGQEQPGLAVSSAAVALARGLRLDGTVTMGTTLVNAATAYKSFGKADEAIVLYAEAKEIYEARLSPTDARLGGLYNNMALALADLSRYDEAETMYRKALALMGHIPHGEGEMAITWCNLADLAAAKYGMVDGEKLICQCLDTAQTLLDTDTLPGDHHYAFVCENCAPTFGYYGYFIAEQTLRARAKEIYERA